MLLGRDREVVSVTKISCVRGEASLLRVHFTRILLLFEGDGGGWTLLDILVFVGLDQWVAHGFYVLIKTEEDSSPIALEVHVSFTTRSSRTSLMRREIVFGYNKLDIIVTYLVRERNKIVNTERENMMNSAIFLSYMSTLCQL